MPRTEPTAAPPAAPHAVRDAAERTHAVGLQAKPVMLINAFSYIVTAVVLLVCFFSLMSSMVANIQEQVVRPGWSASAARIRRAAQIGPGFATTSMKYGTLFW